MAKVRLSGKLAVILHADVAGSTALVQQDEQIAHERIQNTFRRFGDTITRYHGHVRELRGDALLAEFERASDAVTAALAFQVEQLDYLQQLKDSIQPTVRVGIAMGEVIIADDTITGEGVVLAQRLEQLSEPGAVVIQGAAYETIPGRFPFEYGDLGEHEVKGFDKPVRVYSTSFKPDTVIPLPGPYVHRTRNTIIVVASIGVIVTGIALMWFEPWVIREEPASIERMTFPLPDKPSIAVLPFTNMSDDSQQEYFADGITDDLITDISKVSGLFVIARNSVFTYKGKAVKVRQVAEELGVRYVMEGSVRRVGKQVRINAQLIDATTGGHVWAERYDGSLDDVFELQDNITQSIVTALALTLTAGEQERRGRKETDSPEAYDAFLRGWVYYRLNTPDDFTKAIPYLENAIKLDPDFARAHTALAATYWRIWIMEWAERTGVSSGDAFKQTIRHLETGMKNPTPLAHRIMAKLEERGQHWDEAMAEAERAIALDPNDPEGYVAMSSLLVNLGRAAESLDFIKKAMRLDPQSDYLWGLGYAQFHLESYEEAAATMLRATKRNPDDEWNFLLLAAAYSHLGLEQKARTAMATFNSIYQSPRDKQRSYSLADLNAWTIKDEAGLERLREGLRKIGVPAGTTARPVELNYRDLVTVSAGTFDVEGAIEIDVVEAKTLHDRGIDFIDTRGGGPFERGHIPGATNLLFDQVWDNLWAVVDLGDELVFYCGGTDCHLAAHSSAQALILGYTKVYYFVGGFSAWEAAGYPIEGS